LRKRGDDAKEGIDRMTAIGRKHAAVKPAGAVLPAFETLAALLAEQAQDIAELRVRVEFLETDIARRNDAEDGPMPAPLPPSWQPIKAAAAIAGFSPSGLRKRIAGHRDGPRWWKYSRGRLLINTDRCPKLTHTRRGVYS
jgi:hypothetical protein